MKKESMNSLKSEMYDFLIIPDKRIIEDPNISAISIRVYLYLCSKATIPDWKFSNENIMNSIHIKDERVLIESLKKLSDFRYILNP